MKFPKSIDFTNIDVKKIFEPTSKEYKALMALNDEGEWRYYINEMVVSGVSVVYDASGDFFIVKPIAFKENNNKMYSKGKKLSLSDFTFLNENFDQVNTNVKLHPKKEEIARYLDSIGYYDLAEIIKTGLDEYGDPVNQKNYNLAIEDFKTVRENKGKKKSYDKKKDFTNSGYYEESKSLTESLDQKYLLHDGEDEEENLEDNNVDIEASVNDLVHLDDEDVELATPETAEELMPSDNIPQQPSSTLTVQDIENIVKQFLTGQQSVSDKQTSVPDTLASGEASTVNQDVQGNLDVLESEFAENHAKINVVENKIENDESYLDILNGDYVGESTPIDEPVDVSMVAPVGSAIEPPAEINDNLSTVGSEFDIFEEPEDEPEVIKEASEDELQIIEPVDYEDGDLDLVTPEEEPEIAPNNSIVNIGGTPVKIQITGWLITMPDVSALTEAVKKNKAKLRKLESNNDKELFLYVECNNKIYKIRYEDRPKVELSRPWSIKDKKFATINEAISMVRNRKLENDKQKYFKDLIATDKDLSSRTLSNLKESDIFEDFRNEKNTINYIPGWNVKHVGGLDLKKGLNEVFSNITEHNSKDKNTLFKTKEGKYYLIKGNLGEASQKGEKRHLVDLEGKKDYGVGQVIGIYENTTKGLGQVMYKIQRTSIPLLVWKRK